jgi:general stress protein CsbA
MSDRIGRIAAALFAHYKTGYSIALYILACAVCSIVATLLLPDYTNKDVSEEYA